MTEHLTETQIIEERITRACVTIREAWPHMLPVGVPGKRPGGGSRSTLITAGDDDLTDADIDAITALVALRRETTTELARWAWTIVRDHDITETVPNALDVVEMCTFIERWAQWLSWHWEGPEAADRLGGCAPGCQAQEAAPLGHSCEGLAQRCSRYDLPPETDKATPRTLVIGTCPRDVGQGEPKVCGGKVTAWPEFTDHDADPWATCARCGERAVASVWERWMFPEVASEVAMRDRTLTAEEVITLAHRQFGRPVTKQAIWHWVARDQLSPVDPDAKPHRFRMGEVVDLLAKKVG